MIKKYILAAIAVLSLSVMTGCGSASQPEPAKETAAEQEEAVSKDTEEADSSEAAETGSAGIFEAFTAEDLSGNPVNQDIFKDYDLTMINIWATFCGPCINEMPDLGEIHEAWKEKGVQVVGICVDAVDMDGTPFAENVEAAEYIVQETGADYLHILPTGDLTESLLPNVQVVPVTVFVDKDGKVVSEEFPGSRKRKQWEEIIEPLLAEVTEAE